LDSNINMAPLSTSTADAILDSASPSLLERVQDFVTEHKKAIAIAAAAAVVAGAGVAYYNSTTASSSSAFSESDDGETGKPKKKKTGSRGAKKSTKDKKSSTDGPILEEKKPKVDEIPSTCMSILLYASLELYQMRTTMRT
jgi:import receptor subunit TOM70